MEYGTFAKQEQTMTKVEKSGRVSKIKMVLSTAAENKLGLSLQGRHLNNFGLLLKAIDCDYSFCAYPIQIKNNYCECFATICTVSVTACT
jgi:hypothetical protein